MTFPQTCTTEIIQFHSKSIIIVVICKIIESGQFESKRNVFFDMMTINVDLMQNPVDSIVWGIKLT
jgi:hypothetical protein